MLAYLVAASLPRKQKGSLFPLPSLFVSSETFFPLPRRDTKQHSFPQHKSAYLRDERRAHPFFLNPPGSPSENNPLFSPRPLFIITGFLGAPHTNENVAKRGEAVTTQFRPSSLFPSPDVGR